MDGDALRGYVELARPLNAFVAGVLTFVGAFVAGGALTRPSLAGAAVVATWLATAAGNAINDYFDRDIDRINEPGRPIPRGAVSVRGALVYSVLLFGGAVVFALLLPPLAIAIAVINLTALVAYTRVFKGLPGAGNAVVAYLGGSTFLFGAAAVGDLRAGAVLFVLAALSTFSREIIKDVEDVAGDRAEGLRTLPIVVGERRAHLVAGAVLIIAVAASPLPFVWGIFGLPYLVVVIPADLVMLAACTLGYGNPTRGQRLLKYGMFLAAVAFVVGRIAVVIG
ncbi:geranylgeranylglycerol-phosphate geranylgeranyltransferase [Halanaeroarchaeum sulfurireducens]|uniref:Digeranylgeranylglyceryl phosphate synthase n=1 Tax=Halanaeroarchaeum sulfurireducens TaxID=1604004 RepID=A0A0F7PBM8_9EURY|nr:geranylgeranylglycerol-phosphate geranylgeranyltransferase [Halanaeroarchaeum sulfurireducens]AKH97565.1 UbiA prenyltransferase [Halanaeroarchaeum sulfurireducens]ALG81961.1 UbiA prenyltransferase [Halanaeroarchaeum sulfurireducens]